MNKLVFVDIGELGWSIYLSAHIRWLRKQKSKDKITILTFPDRACLYDGLSDDFIKVPGKFYKKYDINRQDGPGLRKVHWDELKAFFASCVPKGYKIMVPGDYPRHINSDNRIFAPYKYSCKPKEEKDEVLIFPRCRPSLWGQRNLPSSFYKRLIKRLCDKYPELTIRTMGTKNGAYNMGIRRENYINWIGKSETLQDLIDKCQDARCAIGGTSAPPKISLLQGVPTFIIGHEKARFMVRENWMGTKVDFYQIDKRAYKMFDDPACVDAIIRFVRKCK